MQVHETEPATKSKSRVRAAAEWQAKESQAPNSLSYPHAQLADLRPRSANTCSAMTHASLLNRARADGAAQAGNYLLTLQRQYGNRYIQRVLTTARLAGGGMEVAPDVEAAIQLARGGGQALDGKVRTQMESAFGADFSSVRVQEQEAERVAQATMQGERARVERAPEEEEDRMSATLDGSLLQRQPEDEDERLLQPKLAGSSTDNRHVQRVCSKCEQARRTRESTHTPQAQHAASAQRWSKTRALLRRRSLANARHWVAAAAMVNDRHVPFEERTAFAALVKSSYGQSFLARLSDLTPQGRLLLQSADSFARFGSATGEPFNSEIARPVQDTEAIDERLTNRFTVNMGSGRSLEGASQKQMESLLVSNFAAVRLHTDVHSAILADALGVRAFTMGHDIFFAPGKYQPDTAQGRQTLVHELAHVVQQRGGNVSSLADIGQRSDDAVLEREADRAAAAVAFGLPMLVRHRATTATLQAQSACVKSEKLPDNYRTINTSGFVGAYFEMNIDWEEPIPTTCECRCGEYRQYVKGFAEVNGVRLKKPLWGGAFLEETVYHEDGDGTWRRYGHRNEAGFASDVFTNPDRATGCSYRGKDQPGVRGPAGTTVDLLLTFKGQTYDVCASTFGTSHEWHVGFSGVIS